MAVLLQGPLDDQGGCRGTGSSETAAGVHGKMSNEAIRFVLYSIFCL
jgi:hypothetical protein